MVFQLQFLSNIFFMMKMNLRIVQYFFDHLTEFELNLTPLNNLNIMISGII